MMMEMGIGLEPQDGKAHSNTSLHFWLVDKDGNIIDPTPPAYKGKRHYRAFKYNQKSFLTFWWNKWKTHPKKKLMTETLYEAPLPRKCMYNVFVYWKKHKDCKIVIGSLGFQEGNGRIFWEFG